MTKVNKILLVSLHITLSSVFLITCAIKLLWYDEWAKWKDLILVVIVPLYLFFHLAALKHHHSFSLFVCLVVIDSFQILFWLIFFITFHFPIYEPIAVIICCAMLIFSRIHHFRLLRRTEGGGTS